MSSHCRQAVCLLLKLSLTLKRSFTPQMDNQKLFPPVLPMRKVLFGPTRHNASLFQGHAFANKYIQRRTFHKSSPPPRWPVSAWTLTTLLLLLPPPMAFLDLLLTGGLVFFPGLLLLTARGMRITRLARILAFLETLSLWVR